jgi:hypothetical protein
LNRSFTITAEIQVPQGDSSRMTVAQGGPLRRLYGLYLYLLRDKPV